MVFLDVILLGWFNVLDKTIYQYKRRGMGIGPKEHAFFIAFLFHGLNLSNAIRFAVVKFSFTMIPLYFSFIIAIMTFVFGYVAYFRNKRVLKVMISDSNRKRLMLYTMIAILYSAFSVFLMLMVGDLIRGF